MHDCAPAKARMNEGGWEVLILPYDGDDASWVVVPDRALLRRENPDGRRSSAGRRTGTSVASYRRPGREEEYWGGPIRLSLRERG
jgi:hypothetical protein